MEKLNTVKAKNNELRNMAEADLAARINDAHGRFVNGVKTSLESAYEAGMFLDEVKRRVGHGGFMKWVKGNCRFKHGTATNHINVYLHWNIIQKKFRAAQGKNQNLSITAALDSVREEKGTKGKRTKAKNVADNQGDNQDDKQGDEKDVASNQGDATSVADYQEYQGDNQGDDKDVLNTGNQGDDTSVADDKDVLSNTGNAVTPSEGRILSETKGMETADNSIPQGNQASGCTADEARLENRQEDADDAAKQFIIAHPERLVKMLASFDVHLELSHVENMLRFLVFAGLSVKDVAALVN